MLHAESAPVRVAVVQAATVPFDTPAAVEKTLALIAEVGDAGARIAVFPEAFIGGYPKGSTFDSAIGVRTEEGRALFRRYYESSIRIDGPEIRALEAASSEHDVFTIIGIIERDGGTLYCTAIYISPQHGLVGKHRKLMPTAVERLVWGFGDGSTIEAVDSEHGRMGAVICWENYMPLLRQAMYAQDVDFYCAPTADDRPTWLPTMQHIALEGRTFVLSACQAIRASAYPEDYQVHEAVRADEWLMHGGSVIVDPLGNILAGPVWDEETVLYADIDPAMRANALMDLDVTGNYSRADVFTLTVDTRARHSVISS